MKNKSLILLISVLLIVLIASSTALYNMLSVRMEQDKLLIQNESSVQESNNVTDSDTANPNHSTNEPDTSDNTDSSDNAETSDETTPFMAPDFTVYDSDGNIVRLSDFLGKPVVLNFWASWCGPCKMEMPAFEELYHEYGEEVQFIMVNLTDGARETVEIATTFLETNHYTFPVFFDKDTDAAWAYQVYGIPVTYFINAEGHLVAQGSSALDTDTIRKGIELISE